MGDKLRDEKLWFLGLFTDKELSGKAEVIRMAAGQGRGSVYNILRRLSIEVTERHRVLKRESEATPQPLVLDDATVELIAHAPSLRSVRDLEPGWWFVRRRINGGEWFVMLLSGNAPLLHVAGTLFAHGDVYAEPHTLSHTLASDDADEWVQVAGPIRPPEVE